MQHAQDLELDLDVIRPWRRATIAVSAVATLELIALAAIAIALLGTPYLRRRWRSTAPTPR